MNDINNNSIENINVKNDINFCVCELDGCKLFLERPIILPCGSTICSEHVEKSCETNETTLEVTYKCTFCEKCHAIPVEGFPYNKIALKIINLNAHLTGLQKNGKKSVEELERVIEDFNHSGNTDKDNFIFEQFSIIKNRVDLHREILFRDINKKYDEILLKLSDIELECKENKHQIEEINLDDLTTNLIPKWKQELRIPNLDDEESKTLLKQIDENSIYVKSRFEKQKNDLLMHKDIQFKEKNDISFGELIVSKSAELKFKHENSFTCSKTLHHEYVHCIKIIKESDILISYSPSVISCIRIWDLKTNTCINTLESTQSLINAILPISKTRFITCSDDKSIRFWNIHRKQFLMVMRQDFKIRCLCLLDNDRLLSGCTGGKITLWNLDSLTLIGEPIKAHGGPVTSIVKSKTQNLVISSSGGTVKLWDSNNLILIKVLLESVYQNMVVNLAFREDESLIGVSKYGDVLTWNISTREFIDKTRIDKISPDDFRLISNDLALITSGENLIIYDLNLKTIVKVIETGLKVNSVDVFENGDIVSCHRLGAIHFWTN